VWLPAGRLGEDGSVRCFIKISVKSHTPFTGPHLPTHAHITHCLADRLTPDKPHTHYSPNSFPADGTGALDLHGLGLSVGSDTSPPHPHKARQGKARQVLTRWLVSHHSTSSVDESQTDTSAQPQNQRAAPLEDYLLGLVAILAVMEDWLQQVCCVRSMMLRQLLREPTALSEVQILCHCDPARSK